MGALRSVVGLVPRPTLHMSPIPFATETMLPRRGECGVLPNRTMTSGVIVLASLARFSMLSGAPASGLTISTSSPALTFRQVRELDDRPVHADAAPNRRFPPPDPHHRAVGKSPPVSVRITDRHQADLGRSIEAVGPAVADPRAGGHVLHEREPADQPHDSPQRKLSDHLVGRLVPVNRVPTRTMSRCDSGRSMVPAEAAMWRINPAASLPHARIAARNRANCSRAEVLSFSSAAAKWL